MQALTIATLLFLSAVFLFGIAITVEQLGRLPNAPEWASAIGGLLAVAAAALIAMHQSSQARRTVEKQAALHREALQRQEDLQRAALNHQSKLQQDAFDHQIRLEADRRAQAKALAVGSSKIVFDMARVFIGSMNADEDWNKSFHEVHYSILAKAASILDAVPHASLGSENDLIEFGHLTAAFTRIMRDFDDLCDEDQARSQALNRYWIRKNYKRMRIALRRLDPAWKPGSLEDEAMTEIEQEAYDEVCAAAEAMGVAVSTSSSAD